MVVNASLSPDGDDKAVTASLHVFDVFGSELPVSKRLAERKQMDAKAPFFDGHVGPCLRDQYDPFKTRVANLRVCPERSCWIA